MAIFFTMINSYLKCSVDNSMIRSLTSVAGVTSETIIKTNNKYLKY